MKESKTRHLLMIAAVIVLLIGVFAATALAQNATPTATGQDDATTDEGLVKPYHGMMERGFGHFGGKGAGNDEALAEALGITVEELDAARQKAFEQSLADAVAAGSITQEQADQMLAMRALQAYLDHEALMAEALGMTVEELEAALSEGKAMSDLLTEQGLTVEQLHTNMQTARDAAVQKAVADGVITQEQADAFLNGEAGMGHGYGGHGFGGHGFGGHGFGGHGFGGPGFGGPDMDGDFGDRGGRGHHGEGMGSFGGGMRGWGGQGQQTTPQTGSGQGA